VSNDIAHAEASFGVPKHRPEFLDHDFANVNTPWAWTSAFVVFGDFDHRHGGMRCVSPTQQHAGLERVILQQRQEVCHRPAATTRRVGLGALETGSRWRPEPQHCPRRISQGADGTLQALPCSATFTAPSRGQRERSRTLIKHPPEMP